MYANGNRYNGDWVNGRITGSGVLTFADGERYEGELKDGRMQVIAVQQHSSNVNVFDPLEMSLLYFYKLSVVTGSHCASTGRLNLISSFRCV